VIGSGIAVASFIAWRLPALLHAPRDGGEQYVPSLVNVPLRWLEYQVFMPMVPGFEAHTVWQRPLIAWVCGVAWAALLVALWMTRRRLTALFLVGDAAALAPVLVLGSSANHYAYGFAAMAAMCVAAAWPKSSRPAQLAIGTFAALTALHGAFVMLQLTGVARVQSVFSPELARVMQTREGVVRLRPAADAKPWIFLRLTHQIPAYAGVEIGDRVRVVESGQPADYEIAPDGRLLQLK
jgi:hypothetical protein